MAGGRCGYGQGAFWADYVGPNLANRAKNGVKRSLLVEADDGILKEHAVEAPPVFDGLIAAARLYLATTDGMVLCFAGVQ